MTATINLLPWRQSRRYACLQWWGTLLSGSLLAIVGIALGYYALSRVDNRVELLLADAEKMRAETLMALKPRLQQRQQQWQQAQQREKRREQMRSWHSVLQGVAELLPEQAWFTGMTWQQDTLELTGLALNVAALHRLETQLRKHPRFQLGSPGETRQDAQGRWQFHYRLIRSGMHAGAL
ncbi:PilN domain-containing protein [Citrobacter sp. U14242]|uniref:PilN domain-containing protein n=1 Tax=Citrobacter sp. U14242 TaxID=3390192 RepID=UPI00397A469A